MSAIGGILKVDGSPVSKEILQKMKAIVDYSGPDGGAVWLQEGVGLTHNLLITSPEGKHEKQPLTNGRGLWITADCRLDNREELSQKLGLKKGERDQPDAAYLLWAYEAWGEEATSRLSGDFAFAVWDERTHTLFCGRDPLGIKSFVYFWDCRRFIFGSYIKQIFVDDSVSNAPNLCHLADWLTFTFPNREETAYQAIQRLPPGHCLIVRRGELTLGRYWDWEPDEEPSASGSMEENAETFRRLFTEAVRVRLRAPEGHRTGSFLSGGLDSSSIVAVAASQTGPSFPTFSLHFPETDSRYQLPNKDATDESSYRDELIRKYSLESHVFDIKGWGPFENLRSNLLHLENPLFFPTTAYFQYALQSISSRGVRTLLHGEGGDELFWVGPNCFPNLLSEGRLSGFLKEWRGRHRHLGHSHLKLLSLTMRALLPDFFKFPYRRWIRKDIPDWFNPAFAKKISLKDRTLRSFEKDSSFQQSPSHGILIWLKGGVPPLYLETFYRLAGATGLEVRLPFLDVKLLRFMAGIPWPQRSSAGITKRLLREALKETLPKKITNRLRKTEFTPVIRASLEKYASKEIKEVCENPHPLIREMIVPKRVKRLAYDYLHPYFMKHPSKDLSTQWSLWYLMSVDQWLKRL